MLGSQIEGQQGGLRGGPFAIMVVLEAAGFKDYPGRDGPGRCVASRFLMAPGLAGSGEAPVDGRVFLMSLRSVLRDIKIVRELVYPAVLFYRRLRRFQYRQRPFADAGAIIADAIKNKRPCSVGKLGLIEANCIYEFLKRSEQRQRGRQLSPYSARVCQTILLNAGVFPATSEALDEFSATWLAAVRDIDVIAVCFSRGEAGIVHRYCPAAVPVTLESLEPYRSSQPWSVELAGKRVLSVHPFSESIRKQYARRNELWDDPRVLPPFSLSTITVPLSAGLVPPRHPDWCAALADMTAQMDRETYDVAIIGAGAFSLPLAAHAKRRGKVGIHLGGAAQILWGIYGGRWLDDKMHQGLFRSTWVRPSPTETPEGVGRVERSAYW